MLGSPRFSGGTTIAAGSRSSSREMATPRQRCRGALHSCGSTLGIWVRNTMDRLLQGILDDDRVKVGQMLESDRGLATRTVEKARLYDSKILHWIYAGDTALHLAAAGYRIEI